MYHTESYCIIPMQDVNKKKLCARVGWGQGQKYGQ